MEKEKLEELILLLIRVRSFRADFTWCHVPNQNHFSDLWSFKQKLIDHRRSRLTMTRKNRCQRCLCTRRRLDVTKLFFACICQDFTWDLKHNRGWTLRGEGVFSSLRIIAKSPEATIRPWHAWKLSQFQLFVVDLVNFPEDSLINVTRLTQVLQ